MTDQGDPLKHRHAYVSHPGMPRRKKLDPDPDVRRAIVAAASKSVREQGVRGLNVATVLERAQLSTRAFYRHFESKDQLVAANPKAEKENSKHRGPGSGDSKVDRRKAAILEPLVEQLQRGLELRAFKDIVPMTAARSIDGVVWAGAQLQRSTDYWDRSEVRERALRFCLRGLGVAAEIIEQVAGRNATAG
jgi:hypothetical protein